MAAFMDNLAFAPPKTKTQSLLRSAAFPGLGQLYNDRKLEGYAFAGSAVLFGALAMTSNSGFTKAQTDYNTNLDLYNTASNVDDIASYRVKVEQAYQEMASKNTNLMIFSSYPKPNAYHPFRVLGKDFKSKNIVLKYDGF